jgi:hypothetical protein
MAQRNSFSLKGRTALASVFEKKRLALQKCDSNLKSKYYPLSQIDNTNEM